MALYRCFLTFGIGWMWWLLSQAFNLVIQERGYSPTSRIYFYLYKDLTVVITCSGVRLASEWTKSKEGPSPWAKQKSTHVEWVWPHTGSASQRCHRNSSFYLKTAPLVPQTSFKTRSSKQGWEVGIFKLLGRRGGETKWGDPGCDQRDSRSRRVESVPREGLVVHPPDVVLPCGRWKANFQSCSQECVT